MSADAVHSLANYFLVGSLVVGVFATWAVIVSGNRKEEALKRELARANQAAAEANAAAAEANERTEVLRKQNLELEGNLLKMRREVSGRWLTFGQVESLVAKAAAFRGQHMIFEFDRDDIEATTILVLLQDKLGKGAGWNMEFRLPSTPLLPDVHIASGPDKRSQDAAAMLVEELGASFPTFPFSPPEPIEEGTVKVRIGPRLPPFANIK